MQKQHRSPLREKSYKIRLNIISFLDSDSMCPVIQIVIPGEKKQSLWFCSFAMAPCCRRCWILILLWIMVLRCIRSGMDLATFSVSKTTGDRPVGVRTSLPGCKVDVMKEILDESYVGVDCINTSTSICFSVAGKCGVRTFQLDSMDLQELQKLTEFLENPKCMKIGVDLAKVMALLSSLPHWPHLKCLDSWVDLSEFLWSHSIMERRPSLSDIQMLNPQSKSSASSKGCSKSSTSPMSSTYVASLCRDLWPIARGLAALKDAKTSWPGIGT